MVRPEKVKVVEETRKIVEDNSIAIVTDYRGLNVAQVSALREQLRDGETECKVLKNTLVRIAFNEAEIEYDDEILSGPSMFIFGKDPVFPAKILNDFAKKNEFLKIKGGFLGKKQISAQEVVRLATLPSREQLIAQVVGTMNAPIAGFVNVLAGPIRKLVYSLEAIKKQKEEQKG